MISIMTFGMLIVLFTSLSILLLFIIGEIKGVKSKIKYRFVSLMLMPLYILGCSPTDCVIRESTFFLVMTNIQYYPEEYLNKDITFDCFAYNVSDIADNVYLCGVRKCTAGFGCTCGKDTVIGFILNYDGTIPEPINQYEDTNDKAWIHLVGQLSGAEKTSIEIYSYDAEGNRTDQTEVVEFLSFNVSVLEEIVDYSDLAYFVSK